MAGVVFTVAGLKAKCAAMLAKRLPKQYIAQLTKFLRKVESDNEKLRSRVQLYLNNLQWFQEVHGLNQGLASILIKEFAIERENTMAGEAMLYDIGVQFFNSVQTMRSTLTTRGASTFFQLTNSLTDLAVTETESWAYFLQSDTQASVTNTDDAAFVVNGVSSILKDLKSMKKWNLTSTSEFICISIDKLKTIKNEMEEKLKQFY